MPNVKPVTTPAQQWGRDSERRPVNTNEVLQKSLSNLNPAERNSVVIRCDELPVLWGEAADYEQAFALLLHLILNEKGRLSTFYLHIHCTTEDIGSAEAAGLAQYSIQFNSNLLLTDEWLGLHQPQLTEARERLQQNGAALVVNQLKSAGCLFSISVPGKTF